jgi:hypothetical protein
MKNRYFFSSVIIIYLSIAILIPGFFFEVTTFEYIVKDLIYLDYPLSFSFYWIVFFVIAICVIFDTFIDFNFLFSRKILIKDSVANKAFAGLILFGFAFSVWSFFFSNAGWRYSAVGISKGGALGQSFILAIVPNVYKILGFYLIFIKNLFKRQKLLFQVLFIVSLFLMSNGVATALVALIISVGLVFEKFTKQIFFRGNGSVFKKLWRLAIFGLFFVFAIVFSKNLGNYVKTEGNGKESAVNSEQVTIMKEWFINRVAVYYISTKASFYSSKDVRLEKGKLLGNFADNVSYRFNAVVGLNKQVKPELSTVSLINYYQITPKERYNLREGTAPGLIGGFVLMFSPFYCFFYISFYLLFLKAVFTGFNKSFRGNLTIFGKVIFLYWVFRMLDDPLDFLLIIDDSLFVLFLIIIIPFFKVKSHETCA